MPLPNQSVILDPRNLFIKNLDYRVDDGELLQLFTRFGKIISAKVMRDPNGKSKGFGFVSFSKAEDAGDAMREMNGKINETFGKPLFVGVAEPRSVRNMKLDLIFK